MLAVESGSRAWGFASTDSDYDVRFIYIRPRDFYLKLESTRDVIEIPIEGAFDINGWDLNKTLRLAYKSNPTLFEWSSSPVVYRDLNFCHRFRPILEVAFRREWDQPLSSYGQGHFLFLFKGSIGSCKKVFLCASPHFGLLLDFRKGNAPAHVLPRSRGRTVGTGDDAFGEKTFRN